MLLFLLKVVSTPYRDDKNDKEKLEKIELKMVSTPYRDDKNLNKIMLIKECIKKFQPLIGTIKTEDS